MSMSTSEPFPGEGEADANQSSPPRRKSVFSPQTDSDMRRSYVRDISAAPVESAGSVTALKNIEPKKPNANNNAPSTNPDANLLSALAKLDAELSAKV